MNKTLTHSMKSYITIFWVGILVGCICRLTDYCPADTLWSFSSIQTLLGFWIITNTIIVLASTSNICAGISSFLYMFGMTLSFYGLQAILGTFIPLFSGGVFVKRKCEQKGPKKVSTFSTRFHVVSNVFPKYQMLTF